MELYSKEAEAEVAELYSKEVEAAVAELYSKEVEAKVKELYQMEVEVGLEVMAMELHMNLVGEVEAEAPMTKQHMKEVAVVEA